MKIVSELLYNSIIGMNIRYFTDHYVRDDIEYRSYFTTSHSILLL